MSKIKHYIRRPEIVEAIQLTFESYEEVLAFIVRPCNFNAFKNPNKGTLEINIQTPFGYKRALKNDYLVKTLNNGIEVYSPDNFKLLFKKDK